MEVQTLHHSWLTHWFMLTWAPAACVIHGTALTPKIDLLRRQATQLLLATIAGGWQHNRNDSHLRKTIMNPYVCMSVCLSVCLSVCVCISECMCIYIYIGKRLEVSRNAIEVELEKNLDMSFSPRFTMFCGLHGTWKHIERLQHADNIPQVCCPWLKLVLCFFKFFILCCFVETSRTACW